jgi:hypothetical protein
MAKNELDSAIDIWGGRSRQPILELFPFSLESLGEKNGTQIESLRCSPMCAYIKEFPKIEYGTSWGEWDKSNTAFVTNKITTFGGAGDSIPARIVQMLAGPNYQPPITTDKWTQLTAQLSDDAYMKLSAEIVAFPLFKGTTKHVEGLRYDSDNLSRATNIGAKRTSSLYDWLSLGQRAMMPEPFSTKIIKDNVMGIKENIFGEGTSGKAILSGAHDMAHVIDGLIPGNGIDFQDAVAKGVYGLETFVRGVCGTHQRFGHTFTLRIRDDDTNLFIDSTKPKSPVDFYITELKFKFSQHLVKIVDENGKRKGVAPEWAVINISFKSACAVSRDQMMQMFTR